MKKITQESLKQYATLTNQVQALSKEAAEMKADFIDALKHGAKVQPGERVAELKTEERRSVSWREIVIRLKSVGYVNQVLAATKPLTIFKLVVK